MGFIIHDLELFSRKEIQYPYDDKTAKLIRLKFR